MFSGWYDQILVVVQTFNDILTAGIAIMAFSLLLYALSFNLRDRVARSFAIILISVVIVFTSEALQDNVDFLGLSGFFLRFQWVGIVYLPAAYLHLSDAVLVTAGRPSRGRRRLAVRLMYLVSTFFLVLLPLGQLVGAVVEGGQPAPHLQRTFWTEIFTIYYLTTMLWAWVNFTRAYRLMLTRSGRRRMLYLMAGATAPALGSYPYLLYGSPIAAQFPLMFWTTAMLVNLAVGGLIVVMAYAVAFFGVSWPDRVVKSRLFKWIMRGPVTASVTLGVMTVVRRVGESFGVSYSAAVPVAVVACVLLLEHLITLIAPLWERFLFYGGDRQELILLQKLEERLLTQSDLRQFLEAVLAAVRDSLQSSSAFVAALDDSAVTLLVSAGRALPVQDQLGQVPEIIDDEDSLMREYVWGDYWIFPLRQRRTEDQDLDSTPPLLGFLGVARNGLMAMEREQRQSVWLLANRAALALEDRRLQQNVFRSIAQIQPQVELLQRLRAAGRYDSTQSLLNEELPEDSDMVTWVKDALNHYWGGPKLTQSPLLKLRVVQQAAEENEGNLSNALRSVLRRAVEQVRPQGERRFTTEWILYNILEMKFIEGRKVREVAAKLAMSEADLYRKQRVAVEAVARAILEMENETE
ncbi:MAG: histidine kinase N-terminal 7TM domain-containing protein [Anaerolineales bacterium]